MWSVSGAILLATGLSGMGAQAPFPPPPPPPPLPPAVFEGRGFDADVEVFRDDDDARIVVRRLGPERRPDRDPPPPPFGERGRWRDDDRPSRPDRHAPQDRARRGTGRGFDDGPRFPAPPPPFEPREHRRGRGREDRELYRFLRNGGRPPFPPPFGGSVEDGRAPERVPPMPFGFERRAEPGRRPGRDGGCPSCGCDGGCAPDRGAGERALRDPRRGEPGTGMRQFELMLPDGPDGPRGRMEREWRWDLRDGDGPHGMRDRFDDEDGDRPGRGPGAGPRERIEREWRWEFRADDDRGMPDDDFDTPPEGRSRGMWEQWDDDDRPRRGPGRHGGHRDHDERRMFFQPLSGDAEGNGEIEVRVIIVDSNDRL